MVPPEDCASTDDTGNAWKVEHVLCGQELRAGPLGICSAQGIAPETAEPGSSHQEGSTFNRDYGVQGLWVWAEEECGPNTAVLDYERSLGLKELRGLSFRAVCRPSVGQEPAQLITEALSRGGRAELAA